MGIIKDKSNLLHTCRTIRCCDFLKFRHSLSVYWMNYFPQHKVTSHHHCSYCTASAKAEPLRKRFNTCVPRVKKCKTLWFSLCRHQVLRIIPRDEVQLSLVKDLEEIIEFEVIDQLLIIIKTFLYKTPDVFYYFCFFQLDFWRDVTDVSVPVDVRVPFHSLQSVKIYLEVQNIEYSIMIQDLQVRLVPAAGFCSTQLV